MFYTPCYVYVKFNHSKNLNKMEIKDLNEVVKYFKEYTSREDGKYYFHKENDNFKIIISTDNELYQLNTDHEPWGVELDTIDNLKIRFKSFTGENLEDVSKDNKNTDKKLQISDVINRREQLILFAQFVQNDYYGNGIERAEIIVDRWLNRKKN